MTTDQIKKLSARLDRALCGTLDMCLQLNNNGVMVYGVETLVDLRYVANVLRGEWEECERAAAQGDRS